MPLLRRRALVTGGAVRIGRVISLELARLGFDVAIHYRSSEAEAYSCAEEIRELGREVLVYQADFREGAAPAALASAVESAWGALDLLVNNADVFTSRETVVGDRAIPQITPEEWETAFSVGLRAPMFLVQKLAHLLEASPEGQVINVLDEFVERPATGRVLHSLTKAALMNFTEIAAKTYEGKFRVKGLMLGAIMPTEELRQGESEKIEWKGVGPVIEGIRKLVRAPAK